MSELNIRDYTLEKYALSDISCCNLSYITKARGKIITFPHVSKNVTLLKTNPFHTNY